MLIRFTVENFRSFKNESTLSLIPGKSRSFPKHIVGLKGNHNIDVLKSALLYGANASGKSNLVRAVDFARRVVVEGLLPKKRFNTEPYRLNDESLGGPSHFEFEFVVEDDAYAYGFILDQTRVHEEWLYKIDSKIEAPIFERITDKNMHTSVILSNALKESSDGDFLNFVAKGTRENQFYLSKAVGDNYGPFEKIYSWFEDTLTVLYPNSKYVDLVLRIKEDSHFKYNLSKFLKEMGTGIDDIHLEAVDFDSLSIPEELRADIISELDENSTIILGPPSGKRLLISLDEKSAPQAEHIFTVRETSEGGKKFFELTDESDGTQRLLDLFPLLHGSVNDSKVFIVDELERSLHPNLVKKFLEWFLNKSGKCQMIVTSHESTLLNFLRRDSVWFIRNSLSEGSVLYSLEEFKPRNDLDIQKGYLHGRYGAIPILGENLDLIHGSDERKNAAQTQTVGSD